MLRILAYQDHGFGNRTPKPKSLHHTLHYTLDITMGFSLPYTDPYMWCDAVMMR